MDEAIWTIQMNDRTMAVLIIAFALWIFLTLALMRSNNELRKRGKPRKWEECGSEKGVFDRYAGGAGDKPPVK